MCIRPFRRRSTPECASRRITSAVLGVIACGGDTDTLAAITGAVVGAGAGEQNISQEWLDGLAEWPCTVRWMRTLGDYLAQEGASPKKLPQLPVPALMLRNAAFIVVVLLTLIRWYSRDAFCFPRSLMRGSFRKEYLNH